MNPYLCSTQDSQEVCPPVGLSLTCLENYHACICHLSWVDNLGLKWNQQPADQNQSLVLILVLSPLLLHTYSCLQIVKLYLLYLLQLW